MWRLGKKMIECRVVECGYLQISHDTKLKKAKLLDGWFRMLCSLPKKKREKLLEQTRWRKLANENHDVKG